MKINSIAQALATLEINLAHLLSSSLFILLKRDGSIIEISENRNNAYSLFVNIISKEKSILSIFEISEKDLFSVSDSLSITYPLRKTIDKGMVYWDDLETDLPLAGIKLIKICDNSILGIFQTTELLPAMQYFGMGAFFLLDSNERFRAYSTGILSEKAEQTNSLLIGKHFGDYFTPSISAMEAEAFRTIKDKERYTKLYSQSELLISSTNDFSTQQFPLPNHTEPDFIWTVQGKVLSGEAPQLLFGRINKSIDNVGSGCFQMGRSSDGFMFKRNGMKIRWRKDENSLPATHLFDYKWIKQGILHQFYVNGKIILQAIGDFPSQLYAEAFQILLRPHSQVSIDVFEINVCGSKNSDNSRTFGIVREKSEPFRTFQLARFVNPALSGKWLEYEGWVLNDASHFVRETEDYKTKYSREAKSRKELAAKVDRLQGSNESPMIGQNPLVTQIKEKCLSVADSSIPILLTGETGTGKEVLAKFIHNTGKRKTKPFIKVDCSAIPATLIESALFGHEKGAFTGATDKKMGLFETANHGTLFLDEVGNIPLSVQVKLLGVLQDRLVTKVGGTTPVKLDIQIISATKESLKDLVRKEIFREDLYYRLNALVFELPPLRNRKDDIPLLCEHILSENVVNNGKRITILPETYRKLFNYSWPGNIRELRNVIHKAAIFCISSSISPEDIEFQDTNESGSRQNSRWENIRSYTKDDWVKIITEANGNMSKAARSAGVTRKAVYDNIKKHNISIGNLRIRSKD